MLVIKFLLFLLSMLGYTNWLKTKGKIDHRLVYIEVIAAQILILYLAALLGYLEIVGAILYYLGLILLLGYFWYYRSKALLSQLLYWEFATVLMLLYLVVFILGMWDLKLVHYDNFTHWATIVKFLVMNHHLPTAHDTIITYNTYPVGSSMFLYYIGRFVGFHDGILMIGQFLTIAAAQYAVFATTLDRKRALPVAIIFVSFILVMYFNIAIRYNNLLVDALIAVLAIGALAGIYAYPKQPIRTSLHVDLVLSVLILVKTSAVFFVAIVLMYYVGHMIKLHRKAAQKVGWATFITVLMPFVFNFSWSLHVKNVIGTAASTKHQVGAGSVTEILNGQLTPEMTQVVDVFMDTVLDIQTPSTMQFVLLLGGFLIFTLFYGFKFKKWRVNLGTWFFLIVMTLVYYIGNLIMFLTAMPHDEAIRVAGYERYLSTMVIFVLGVLTITLVRQLDRAFYEQRHEYRNNHSFKNMFNKKVYQTSVMLITFFFVGNCVSEVNGMHYIENSQGNNAPTMLQAAIKGQTFDMNGRYLIVSSNQEWVDNYLLMYLGRYQMWADDVVQRYDFVMDNQQFIELLNGFDGVVVMDDHYTFNAMIEKLTGKKLTPGYYPIDSLGLPKE